MTSWSTGSSQPILETSQFWQRSEERREGKSVDLGGRRIIKKKKRTSHRDSIIISQQ